ncbi:HD-GYP domain-containing protein [Cohnella lubricantis]|uniref:HD-GYP domain-containing protein n=1 Tax=Cohnella lubricantis TaxID=2163172 RepID=A0A841TAC9_9BACL|nr:HD-GYP domain-containing protein [Cohnella lubricantis]MBB6678254.1 HD-GYP domain-containing protein [Cohnella lubricantis]MBP2120108.1 HD-GYP domain-containing protein (c-di-GMP phosphodiesterase class II) [Cohnella lubricantis]
MPVLPVSQVRPGDCLAVDVHTTLGSVLLQEGKSLTARDLEILQAFLVPSVDIRRSGVEASASAATNQETAASAAASEVALTSLQQKFVEMEMLLTKAFASIGPGQKLMILEIRNGLRELLELINDYSILMFIPPLDREKNDRWIRKSVLMALTSYQLARWCKFPEKDWTAVALAALLHDIGNTRVDSTMFRKPSGLTPAELNEMRQHTVYGFRLLEGVPSLNQGVSLAALQHHERIDGSGYPMKVAGDKIHPYAKIVAIADMYHAMTSARSHRKAESPYLVLERLQSEAFGKLDPFYVQTFIDRTTQFHNGMLVQLNDNRVGEIVFTDRSHPTRPMVSVNGEIINLAKQRDLYICSIYAM